MIRSSKHSLKFTNQAKAEGLSLLVLEYRKLLQAIIDNAWTNGIQEFGFYPQKNKLNLLALLPTHYLKQFDTWVSARLRQAAGKQAVAMLKSAVKKRKKQLYMLKVLQSESKPTKYLQSKIDRQPLVKPDASRANLELDQRFIDFEKGNTFSFVRLTSLGKKLCLKLPIKDTKVSNRWLNKGKLKASIRLSKNTIYLLYYVIPKPPIGKEIVGADQGITTCLTLSNGSVTRKCNHNHDLSSIQAKMSRKRKGFKSFARAQSHRKNYINWSLNRLNFNNIKEVRLEKIKNIRFKSRTSRYLSHWKYTLIKEKLVRLGEEKGFLFTEVKNEFRSQRCSQCGWVRKANRKGKTFKCGACNYIADSDLNAASNLRLNLFEVPFWVRLHKLNREGFYWNSDSIDYADRAPIVPCAT